MSQKKFCGECGQELTLVTEHTAANSQESVGGQYQCMNCGDEMIIAELNGQEITRVPIR